MTDLQNSFTGTLYGQFAIMRLLYIYYIALLTVGNLTFI